MNQQPRRSTTTGLWEGQRSPPLCPMAPCDIQPVCSTKSLYWSAINPLLFLLLPSPWERGFPTCLLAGSSVLHARPRSCPPSLRCPGALSINVEPFPATSRSYVSCLCHDSSWGVQWYVRLRRTLPSFFALLHTKVTFPFDQRDWIATQDLQAQSPWTDLEGIDIMR